jgi:hypothetical protein
MEKCYGNYLGLVVNDQDPEGRDRVQIYVPGVTNTIYDNWNNNDINKSIGIDIGSTFTLNEEILKKLRSVLPWAEKATPLIGPGTAMYHQEGRGADSAVIPSDDDWVEVDVALPSSGAKGGDAEINQKVNDDGSTSITIDPYEGEITDIPDKPTDILGEGVPQGTRSSTKILSRVWLFFYGGDIQKPVFFAYSLPPNETYAHNNVKVDNNLNQDNLNLQLPAEQLPDEQLPDENLTDNQIEAQEWLDKIITEKKVGEVDDILYGNKSTFTQDTKDPYVFRDNTTGLVYSVNYLNGNYSSSLLSKSIIINDPKPNDRDYIAPYQSPNNNKTSIAPIPSNFFN